MKAEFNCKRCGFCCMNAFLALDNIPADKDVKEIARLMKYHHIEPMKYKGTNGEDVLALRIPLTCEHLVQNEDCTYACKIYETRPVACKQYHCKRVIEDGVMGIIKNGIKL